MQREIKTLEEAVLALREMYGARSGAHITIYADGSAAIYSGHEAVGNIGFFIAPIDTGWLNTRKVNEGLIFEDGEAAPPPVKGFLAPKK